MVSKVEGGSVRDREEEFREFVAASQARLIAFAELLNADRGRAEDLVQDAYVAAYAAWPRIRDGFPEAYARRVVINGGRSWWRRQTSRERPIDIRASAQVAGEGDVAGQVDERLLLLSALGRLTLRERSVLALRYYVGLSEAEIASELGVAPGTVKSAAARALSKLRADPIFLEGADR